MRNWEVFKRPHKPARQNDGLIIDLRQQGASFAEIADMLGYRNAACARVAHFKAKQRMLNSSGAVKVSA